MDVVQYAYKLTVVYYDKKRSTRLLIQKPNEDMQRILDIKDAHEGDQDVEYVTLVRTRAPRKYLDLLRWQEDRPIPPAFFYRLDDSGAVQTPGEQKFARTESTVVSLPRSDAEKIDWARMHKFDDRTCTWM